MASSSLLNPEMLRELPTMLLQASPLQWLAVLAVAFVTYCIYEQMRFTWWRRQKDGSLVPGA